VSGARALARLGHSVDGAVGSFGRVTLMVGAAIKRATQRPRKLSLFAYQVMQVGVRSLPLAITMAGFAGMVLAFQFGYGLERFGAKLLIGQTTVIAVFRELGPILTALVVGGRITAGIAAELGGMAVTEQVDAVRALGADPLARLVAPRLVATTLAMPLLTICADVVAVAGAMLIASVQYGVGARLFLRGVYEYVDLNDFGSGLFKSAVFGFLVAAVACYQGLRARNGTEGVGRAATRAVVISALCVLASDFVMTKVLMVL